MCQETQRRILTPAKALFLVLRDNANYNPTD
jgi:hypothetical protein